MMRPGEEITVLGRSARLRGDLECDGDLQIDGEFEGSIRQNSGKTIIGVEGRVVAPIIAENVIVLGSVEGDIRATGRVELRSTAIVRGDIFSGRLSMDESAVLHGRVDPSRSLERDLPLHETSMPQVVERVAPPELVREPEHRQATPLRENNTSAHRVQTVVQEANVRQLPSALAAFASRARKDDPDLGIHAVNARNGKLWHNSETE